MSDKRNKRIRRHKRVRARIKGTSQRPRLSVFRSNRHVLVQLIDDVKGHTLISASDREITKIRAKKTELARRTGELAAEKARQKEIVSAVFDRGGYGYHGQVKAVAEGAGKGGLRI